MNYTTARVFIYERSVYFRAQRDAPVLSAWPKGATAVASKFYTLIAGVQIYTPGTTVENESSFPLSSSISASARVARSPPQGFDNFDSHNLLSFSSFLLRRLCVRPANNPHTLFLVLRPVGARFPNWLNVFALSLAGANNIGADNERRRELPEHPKVRLTVRHRRTRNTRHRELLDDKHAQRTTEPRLREW